MKRKRYSKGPKARVAFEAVKGRKPASELASEYEAQVSVCPERATPDLPSAAAARCATGCNGGTMRQTASGCIG